MQTLDMAYRVLSVQESKSPTTIYPSKSDVETLLAKLGTKPQVTVRPSTLAPHNVLNSFLPIQFEGVAAPLEVAVGLNPTDYHANVLDYFNVSTSGPNVPDT
jgi:hypothetical protein